jgi:hypothetical protein
LGKFEFPLSKLFDSDSLGISLQSHELPEWKGRIRFAAQLKYLNPRPRNGIQRFLTESLVTCLSSLLLINYMSETDKLLSNDDDSFICLKTVSVQTGTF